MPLQAMLQNTDTETSSVGKSNYHFLYISCYFFGSSFFSSGFGMGNLNCEEDYRVS